MKKKYTKPSIKVHEFNNKLSLLTTSDPYNHEIGYINSDNNSTYLT